MASWSCCGRTMRVLHDDSVVCSSPGARLLVVVPCDGGEQTFISSTRCRENLTENYGEHRKISRSLRSVPRRFRTLLATWLHGCMMHRCMMHRSMMHRSMMHRRHGVHGWKGNDLNAAECLVRIIRVGPRLSRWRRCRDTGQDRRCRAVPVRSTTSCGRVRR